MAWSSAALAVGALLVLHWSDPDGSLGDITYLIAVVGAPAVAAVAVWQRRSDRLVGALVTLGLASSAAGDIVWQVNDSPQGGAPNVSAAELGYIAAYGFLGALTPPPH